MISFLAGKPNPATFPFESITLNLKPPLDGSSAASATAGTANGHANGHSNGSAPSGGSVTISGKELDEALQYGATAGLPALVRVSHMCTRGCPCDCAFADSCALSV